MGHLQHPHWRQEQRGGDTAAEQLDARVPFGYVAEHPRDDPPALERRFVGALRRLVAGTGGDVGERLG
jgi:hypothetical protein